MTTTDPTTPAPDPQEETPAFGLAVQVMDAANNAPIPGAALTAELTALDANNVLVPCLTDANGIGIFEACLLTVKAAGYHDYVRQPYRHPALGAGAMPVHLQRR